MADTLKHVGVLGMHWGVRRGYKPRPTQVRKMIGDTAKAGGKAVGKSADAVSKAFVEKHASRQDVNSNFKKATGRDLPKGPVGDRIATALGMRKDKKGVWQATPESYAKATTIGVGLGFVAFFAEMKVRDFVAKNGVDAIVQSAEYAKWLRTG